MLFTSRRRKPPQVEIEPKLDIALLTDDFLICFILLDKQLGLHWDHGRDNVLHTCAMKSSPFCEVIIRSGISPNSLNREGMSPLHMIAASRRGVSDRDTLEGSLSPKTLLDISNLNVTNEHLIKVRDRFFQVPSPADIRRASLDHFALEALLRLGSDPNLFTLSPGQTTPFLLAARSDALSPRRIQLFLQYGGSLLLKDASGKTVMDWIKIHGSDPDLLVTLHQCRLGMVFASTLTLPHKLEQKSPFRLSPLPMDILKVLVPYLSF